MKPWTQVKHYGKNSEQDNQVAQRMQELEEEEAAKYKQRLKSAGMEVTPTKVLPLQPPAPTRSDSQQTPSPQHEAPPRGVLPDSAHEDPPSKRRRTQRGDRKKQYETMLEEPFNVIKQSGQQPATNMTSIKAWVTNLKKTMPADKHKDLDQHIQQVQTLLDEGKYTKVQLQEMATRWGPSISLITAAAASPRTLQQRIAADGAKIFRQLQQVVDWVWFTWSFYFTERDQPLQRRSYKTDFAKKEYDASRELRSGKHDNETVTLLYRLANHMEIPFLAQNDFKTNAQEFEMPHPALNKVLWNHMRKVTTQGRLWKPEPCKCHEFLHEHTGAEYHEGHVAMCTGLETLEFCKGQSNLGAAFANVGACSAFFPSKRRLHDQILNQLRGWLKHHLFPNDDRIVENFESFFEEQWQRHEEHQRHKPQLTHRLIKRLVSALPQNYIIHNEDHANAHLMIYCPNVYNQAAFNTWMDEKTFLLLDKSPEDIKVDMERHTPAAVRKHYKKLLDYNKPIPYMATS
ncbi:hypothetical protein AK812_SmicGene2104 [Symbiodinium microadriaticum]|uniref:Uncharacterized protein n=1 Tax=Symbiodinium microadriaticum TaxID=2951 RepID=A0A1Q9F2H2_SYMMI|nr:hypothetical protein AK812_SmicGene2104 [Symbiodinium microadriaticum]CAE7190176.1 unnamed protein product [Symbiodinium microadriaticum]